MQHPVIDLSALYGTPVFTLQTTESVVKKVYAGTYSGHDQRWRFPAFYPFHQIVLGSLRKAFPKLQLTPRAQAHVLTEDTPPTLPQHFQFVTPPYDHQKEGVLHLYRCLRAGLFYSPGLGKCKITVDFQRLTDDRLLILCPRVMLSTWADEFVKHGQINDVIVLSGSKEEKLENIRQAQQRAPIATVVTYATAALYADEILKIKYNCIVADESHQMKSHSSKRTMAATHLAQRAYRRVLLSGTPSLGSPYDLYPQLRFLAKYLTPETWWAFRKKFGLFYAWEEQEMMPRTVLGYKNFDVLNRRVQLVSLRKTKEECLDLPDQTIIDVPFQIDRDQKTVYNQLVRERQLGEGAVVRQQIIAGTLNVTTGPTLEPYVIADEAITLLNKVDQASSGFVNLTRKNPGICNGCSQVSACSIQDIKPYTQSCLVVKKEPDLHILRSVQNARLEAFTDILEMILQDPDNKVIVWANFITELNDIENAVKELEVKLVRLQGGASRTALQEKMDSFNTDPACRVFLGQVSVGIGITLNAANYTIYYNLPWSLEHYLQSLDRNYRIGQSRKVMVYRLIGKHTIDESKVKALDQKIDFSRLVTSSAICATCDDYYQRCHKYNIKLYDDECKFDREMRRETATIRSLP
jgi:SNF2 family DNA or RNA helicase